jgi:hypothetical protein
MTISITATSAFELAITSNPAIPSSASTVSNPAASNAARMV